MGRIYTPDNDKVKSSMTTTTKTKTVSEELSKNNCNSQFLISNTCDLFFIAYSIKNIILWLIINWEIIQITYSRRRSEGFVVFSGFLCLSTKYLKIRNGGPYPLHSSLNIIKYLTNKWKAYFSDLTLSWKKTNQATLQVRNQDFYRTQNQL